MNKIVGQRHDLPTATFRAANGRILFESKTPLSLCITYFYIFLSSRVLSPNAYYPIVFIVFSHVLETKSRCGFESKSSLTHWFSLILYVLSPKF